MICPHCERSLLRKERTGNTCSHCERRYALDPKTNPLRLNDLRVQRITAALTDNGRVRITPDQLWYALSRKRIGERGFAPGCAGGALVGAGFVTIWGLVAEASFVLYVSGALLATALGIVIARQLGAGGGILPMSRGAFRSEALAEWQRVYGSLPPGVVDNSGRPWPPRPAADSPNPNAVLVCPDPSIAVFLAANGLPDRHGIALVQGLEHVRALLPHLPPRGPVLVLRDADAGGELLVRRLRADFPGRPVIDAGVSLRTIRGLPQAVAYRDPVRKPTADEVGRLTALGEFSAEELKWLAQGWRFPLVGVPPVRLLSVLDRLAEQIGRSVDGERRDASEVGFMTWPGAAGDGPDPAGGR
ncbi:hypothetical protein OG625_01490 [Streptomyces sp. NBC_01351]|uniref:hypothetical protein n=1 Tax=Streptomyces sp. NBC_01351 TaxID=2903833 RepID=UPI002E2FDEC2|nr:hypothetical protein [Streptomyces sp. NBC_01351]